MKTLIATIALIGFTSCSSVKNTSNAVLDQAKTGASIGFSTQKVDKGYEVNANVGTNIFGIEPYTSFKAGIRYAPRVPVSPVAPVLVAPKTTSK